MVTPDTEWHPLVSGRLNLEFQTQIGTSWCLGGWDYRQATGQPVMRG